MVRNEPALNRDAVDVMSELVDGFQGYVKKSELGESRARDYRSNLLWVHATAAMLIAPLFASIGKQGMSGPTFDIMRLIPGAPMSVATVLGFGGFILGLGCVLRSRKLEIAGLIGLAVWYVLIAVSFGGAVVSWYIDGSPPDRQPSLYSPVLYAHFAIIMAVHMSTLVRAYRDDRKLRETP